MVTKNRTIQKIIDGIADKEVKNFFTEDGLALWLVGKSHGREYDPAFLRAHEACLRMILPTQYDEMLRRYEEIYDNASRPSAVLIAYLAIENKIVDCNDLATVSQIDDLCVDYCWNKSVLDWTFYEKGLDNGRFTADDVLRFTEANAEYLGFFLPLLVQRGNEGIWQTLSGYVREAGQSDSLRIQLFQNMLSAADSAALSYFIGEIERNNYYRFKALNEAVTELGDFYCKLTPVQAVAVLKDALGKKLTDYLSRSFCENIYFQPAVRRLYPAEYPAYIRLVLREGQPEARHAFFYRADSAELSRDYAAVIFGGAFDMEDFSFATSKINCRRMERALLPAVFDKMLAMYDGMEKVNYHYPMTDSVPIARDVSKSDVVSVLAEAAAVLDDDKYFACLDARYDSFKVEAQVAYLETAGERTGLDRRACAIAFLKSDLFRPVHFYDGMKILLTFDEAVRVSDYLKSKKQSVKSKIVKEFLASPDQSKIEAYLLSSDKDYKVSAGRDMQVAADKVQREKLKEENDEPPYVCSWVKESVFEVQEPTEEIDGILRRKAETFNEESIAPARLEEFFGKLSDFVEENKDYEYRAYFHEGLVTFGSVFQTLSDVDYRDRFAAFPLGESLKALWQSSLTEAEAVSLLLLSHFYRPQEQKYYAAAYGKKLSAKDQKALFSFFEEDDDERPSVLLTASDGQGYLLRIVQQLTYAVLFDLLGESMLCRLTELFSRDVFRQREKEESKTLFGVTLPLAHIIDAAVRCDEAETMRACARAVCALLRSDGDIDLEAAAKLYERGEISDELLRYIVLTGKTSVYNLSKRDSPLCLYRPDPPYPHFQACMSALVRDSLDAELARGSLATPYNRVIRGMNCFRGAEYFVRSIAAIRGLTLVRSPFGSEKNESISMIMKQTVPAEDDTYEKFAALLKEYGIKDEELIRASLFNPSFIDYAGRALDFPRFRFAAYFFIAHLNESEPYGEDRFYESRKEAIREYSDIDYRDFNDGAFDYRWYKEMVEEVPAERIKMIYDNAKYVTVGGLHKRAQRFFDAMNGKISKEECVERINASRNKDFCLVYSLIPLQGKEDLHERYLFLQDFLKGSKKYGAQRQLSERRTVDVALDNLARAAGYADTSIFVFELEADYPHDIYRTYTVDDLEITPTLRENEYKVTPQVEKKGKRLAAVPAKYAKDQTVAWLKDEVRQLNQKFRRIAASFESAMCDKTVFTSRQLEKMSRERTIAHTLSRLVFLADGKLAVFADGALRDADGGAIESEAVYVAHPVELKKAGLLQAAMDYIVRGNVCQPFKQVMREIYCKSEQELSQEEVLRFRGFNVDLKKCIAALKGRGWGVSDDIGLRKVYHASGIVAALFRKFDDFYLYDLENVNRELHGIFFLDRKSEEVIPLRDVEDVTFSETLRDVDLMITISANAVYDYDLAMSTVEIRREILRSVVSVLGLTNISFLKDNISVKGTYGTYLINIRTGLVFKEGKGNLLLDTVYSTDKPLLLDFIDEDPMTADIVSKAVVLSRDNTLRDPAILREIKG